MYTKSKELHQPNFVSKVYTKVCRSVVYIFYTNIFYTFYIQKFVQLWDTFCIHSVYISNTKCTQTFVEMWDTFCIQTFCVYFVYINSDLLKAYIINIMYTICVQKSYKIYIQIIVSLIWIYFDSFFVHFLVNHCKQLRLETCWLIMGSTYQSNKLLDYIFH